MANDRKCIRCEKVKKIFSNLMCCACYTRDRREHGKGLKQPRELPKKVKIQKSDEYFAELIDKVCEVFAKPADVPVWEWTRDHIKLPQGQGYAGQSYPNWDIAPDMKAIFEQLKNPECREIYLKFGSQSGKTLFEISSGAFLVNHFMANGLFVMPSERLYKRMPKMRLRPVYSISNVGLRDDQKGRSTIDGYSFDNGNFMAFGLATSADSLAEMPCGWVIFDELDEVKELPISPIELVRSRMRTYTGRSKFIVGSTPKKIEGGISDLYAGGKRHVLEMKCHLCNEYSTFDFEAHIKWPEGKSFKEILTQNLAWAECPKCSGKIMDEYHDEMVLGQRWKCLDPDMPDTLMSYHKRAWETVFENWSSTAAAYLQKKDKGPESEVDFWNSWAAEPRDLHSQFVDVGELNLKSSKYNRGQIPADVKAVTIGIDLGKESAWIVLLGWAPQNTVYEFWSARIDWTGNDWERLERGIIHCVNDNWAFLGNKAIEPKIMGACFDSGYDTPRVIAFCKKYPLFKPVKGVVSANAAWTITPADPKDRWGNKSNGVNLYSLKSYYWQDVLQGYLQTAAEMPGSLNLPGDAHSRYIQHLNAEVKRSVKGKDGISKEIWLPVHRAARWDLRDATIYAIVAGHIHGLHQIPKTEERTLIAPPQVQKTLNTFNPKRGSERF